MTASRVTVVRVAELVQADAETVREQVGLVLHASVRTRVAATGAGTLLTLERTVRRPGWLRRSATLRELSKDLDRARQQFGTSRGPSERIGVPCN